MTALDRIKRRALLVGGPSDGCEVPMPAPMPWPGFICSGWRTPDWQHYVYDGDGLYGHVGPCAEIDHKGAEPHDHDDCGGAR